MSARTLNSLLRVLLVCLLSLLVCSFCQIELMVLQERLDVECGCSRVQDSFLFVMGTMGAACLSGLDIACHVIISRAKTSLTS